MKKIIAIISLISILFMFNACNSSSNDYYTNSKNNSTNNKINEIIYNTVKFNTNGGTKIDNISTKTIANTPQTTRTGYLFDGWYFDNLFTSKVSFPLDVTKDMTLYAKWLNLTATTTCTDESIKFWNNNASAVYWHITPNGFDMEKLQALGYRMDITVTYDVYYKKDYNAPFDIGYAGAPKYEAAIYNSQKIGQYKNDLNTSTYPSTKSMTYSARISDLKNDQITLKFSTDNIQNTIYFENITVKYTCYK